MASHLTDTEIHELRAALAHKREALLAALRAHGGEQRGVSDAEIEDGDVAERNIRQDDALQLASFDGALLADVERALAKIEAGTYGVSEDSGAAIPLSRLRAVPWARRTLEEEERAARR
jgi:DnaK suppressor protein